MPLPKEKAWFPPKTYGYGWGMPSRWQGWVVLLGYVIALVAGSVWLAARSLPLYIVYTLGITAVLVVICAWKGEKTSWRWGEEKPPATRPPRQN